jgi:hypothetical protein
MRAIFSEANAWQRCTNPTKDCLGFRSNIWSREIGAPASDKGRFDVPYTGVLGDSLDLVEFWRVAGPWPSIRPAHDRNVDDINKLVIANHSTRNSKT